MFFIAAKFNFFLFLIRILKLLIQIILEIVLSVYYLYFFTLSAIGSNAFKASAKGVWQSDFTDCTGLVATFFITASNNEASKTSFPAFSANLLASSL